LRLRRSDVDAVSAAPTLPDEQHFAEKLRRLDTYRD
jgi:hypothetical protein